LGKQPLNALPHLIAFHAQGAHFLLQLFDDRGLFSELGLGFGGAILGRSTGLPFGPAAESIVCCSVCGSSATSDFQKDCDMKFDLRRSSFPCKYSANESREGP
jgi:hypothetical protein